MAKPTPWIGGPGTVLPAPLESFLSWSLAIGCLAVSGYHYVIGTLLKPYWTASRVWLGQRLFNSGCIGGDGGSGSGKSSNAPPPAPSSRTATAGTTTTTTLPCWLPLTTYSRGEVSGASLLERYQQFVRLLQEETASLLASSGDAVVVDQDGLPELSDTELIRIVRNNVILRRLATLALRPNTVVESNRTNNESSGTCSSVMALPLGQQLIRIWPLLLEAPRACSCILKPQSQQQHETTFSKRDSFMISLILPCHRERGSDVRFKLNHALASCCHPDRVQVIIIDAGMCQGLQEACSDMIEPNDKDEDNDDGRSSIRGNAASSSDHHGRWGHVRFVQYTGQEGRGPCLNFGADHATGRVLAFLHSDTRLPQQWDVNMLACISGGIDASARNDKGAQNRHPKKTTLCDRRVNGCAFGFAIDTSREGLNGGPFPPGIGAVQTTANLRCKLWSLPYGDQCLCIPADLFHYIGGYPHQCFMEDYELVALLRKRAALLPQFDHLLQQHRQREEQKGQENNNVSVLNKHLMTREQLKIVSGEPALCSPRRWQRYGVLYVTFMNSKLVNLYASGLSPDELYRRYYGQNVNEDSATDPQKNRRCSPWEKELLNAKQT